MFRENRQSNDYYARVAARNTVYFDLRQSLVVQLLEGGGEKATDKLQFMSCWN